MLKHDIQQVTDLPWPPSPQDISQESLEHFAPVTLYYLLAWTIAGIDEDSEEPLSLKQRVKVRGPVNRQILAIAQDIVYCSCQGRIRTPKHVTLAASVHHLTGKSNQLPCTGACSCDDGECSNKQNIDTDMGDHLLSEDDLDIE